MKHAKHKNLLGVECIGDNIVRPDDHFPGTCDPTGAKQLGPSPQSGDLCLDLVLQALGGVRIVVGDIAGNSQKVGPGGEASLMRQHGASGR